MAETTLTERSPWSGLDKRGRFGAAAQEPGVIIGEPRPAAMLLLSSRKGQSAELIKSAKSCGVDLPASPRWTGSGDLVVLWAGPGQWLVRGRGSFDDLCDSLAPLAPFGTFIDQSHARATLSVGGTRARDALAKGFDIDLHPRTFKPGDVALTQAAGISAYLWQLDEAPTFQIAVPASFAGSFWHWLTGAAGEFGCEVEDGNGPSEPRPPSP